MKRTRQSRQRGGFTLLEVLLVMAILVVLASLVTVFLVGAQGRGYAGAARTQIGALEEAVKMYRLNTGKYPQNLQELVTPPQGMTPEKWKGPYLEPGKPVPKDPWDNDYQYQLINNGVINPASPTQPFTISSAGENGVAGDQDDISNKPDTST
jgi:general secretion pathway protein G